MRAKTFFYVSLGILALAVAFHLGAQVSQCSIVADPLVGIVAEDNHCFLLGNGEVWILGQGQWFLHTDPGYYPLPVPVSEMKFWNLFKIVTIDNDGYTYVTPPVSGNTPVCRLPALLSHPAEKCPLVGGV